MKKIVSFIALCLFSVLSFAQVKVYVEADSALRKNYTGRLFVFTQSDTTKPFGKTDQKYQKGKYAINVAKWDGKPMELSDHNLEALNMKISDLSPGAYKIVSILDIDPNGNDNIFAPGNLYSRKEIIFQVAENGSGEAHIVLSNAVPERPFNETESIKPINLKSNLLSDFHHQDISIKASIILPDSYNKDTTKIYPVVYIIPGWGGNHYDVFNKALKDRYGWGMGKEKIYVYLNPDNPTPFGLHAFVDSRVNGPWGKALVEELMPYLHKKYRVSPQASKTFVVGQSSGGYASLWLPLHYPKTFGGAWAVSPDPVDFSNITGANIYAKNANFYTDSAGNLIPFFLMNGKFESTIEEFVDTEVFMGDGGQMQSFEAEFGKMETNGKPKLLFDRKTGKINKEVVEDWKPYDMGLFIEKNWKKLEKDLKGRKIHVYAGAEDTYQLDKAVIAFKKKAEKVKADVVVETIPGAHHWSIWSPTFTQRIQNEIDHLIEIAD